MPFGPGNVQMETMEIVNSRFRGSSTLEPVSEVTGPEVVGGDLVRDRRGGAARFMHKLKRATLLARDQSAFLRQALSPVSSSTLVLGGSVLG